MIPLFSALIPLVPAIVQGVEKLFGGGKGAEKKATAVDLLQQIVSKLGGGQVPGELAAALPAIVEWVVQQLKAKGELGPTVPATPPAPVVSGPGLIPQAGQFTFTITGTIKTG